MQATLEAPFVDQTEHEKHDCDLLAVYGRLRCVADVLSVGLGFFNTNGAVSPFLKIGDVAKLPLVCANLIAPSLLGILALHVQRISTSVYRMPFILDSDYWCMLVDCTFVFCSVIWLLEWKDLRMRGWICVLSTSEFNGLIRDIAPAARSTQCLLYLGAAFWKLNTSFLNARSSCATIIFIQLLVNYVPPALRPLQFVASTAPYLAAGVELAVPSLLALAGRLRRAGLLLGLAFSVLIASTPPPNDAGIFSICVLCSSYTFFLPVATAVAWAGAASRCRTSWFQFAAVVVTAVGAVTYFGQEEKLMAPACVIVSLGVARAVWLDSTGQTAEQMPSPGPALRTLWWVIPCVATVYSFGAIALGLMDMSNNEMYASLNESGGSNHLLAPTGLLQRLFATSPALVQAWPAMADTFGGGIVRVEHTNSSAINGVYPGEVTQLLAPEVLQQLRELGHTQRIFAPEMQRVMGRGFSPPNPSGILFVQYTVPVLELRRMLDEARRAGEPFSLIYSRPQRFAYPPEGAFFPEQLLQEEFVTVIYEMGRGGFVTCTYRGGLPCRPDEAALMGPPRGWGAKVLVHNAHPITAEDVCRD